MVTNRRLAQAISDAGGRMGSAFVIVMGIQAVVAAVVCVFSRRLPDPR